MDITSHFNPSQGLMVLSPSGSQKYPDKLDSYSSISTQIRCSSFNEYNKFCMDSCWETENIYYADYDSGYVRKIKFDGTEVASLSLTNPYMVSIIQDSSSMNTTVTYPPQEDKGCWIVDNGTVIKTDNSLNITHQFIGITGATGIIADLDGGCYVAGVYLGVNCLVKLSSNATILAYRSYSSFSPVINDFVEMSLDVSGNLWFSTNKLIYSVKYSNGQIINVLPNPLNPIDSIPLSSGGETLRIGGIDVDRNSTSQYLYIVIGNSIRSYSVKYDQNGTLINYELYSDIVFPYIIKVIQGFESSSLYILEDSTKWNIYDNSSSSSSYIEEWSSSSSSSSLSSESSGSSVSSSLSSESSFGPMTAYFASAGIFNSPRTSYFYDSTFNFEFSLDLPLAPLDYGADYKSDGYYFTDSLYIRKNDYYGRRIANYPNYGMTSSEDIAVDEVNGFAYQIANTNIQKINLSTGLIEKSAVIISSNGVYFDGFDVYVFGGGLGGVYNVERLDSDLNHIAYRTDSSQWYDGCIDSGVWYISRYSGTIGSYNISTYTIGLDNLPSTFIANIATISGVLGRFVKIL